MRSVANLRKRFEAHRQLHALDERAVLLDCGLVLGAGTQLIRMRRDRLGLPVLACAADEERALALLTIAHRRPPSADLFRHVQSAAEYWRAGDKALANLRLAFARLPRLESEMDAWRLHLAGALLDGGFSPRRLLRELGYGDLTKYDPDEPRVPAGHGRASGEWGSGGGSPSSERRAPSRDSSQRTSSRASGQSARPTQTVRPSSSEPVSIQSASAVLSADALTGDAVEIGGESAGGFLGDVSAAALASLRTLALRFSGPAAFFGAIFIPTNRSLISEGTLPGAPNVRYRIDRDTGMLDLTTVGRDGEEVTARAQFRNGVYVDTRTGKPVGRVLGRTFYIDRAAAAAALAAAGAKTAIESKDDGPKLCPAPEPDRPGATNRPDAIEYAQYVSQVIVNPQRDPPLEPGLGFALWDPDRDDVTVFDDCQDTTGIMQEYKGYYSWRLAIPKFKDAMAEEFLGQAKRQIPANDLRNKQLGRNYPIEWHFQEKEVAEFARDLFKDAGYLSTIRIYYDPYDRPDEHEFIAGPQP
ncbi:MAG TPA: hypothetical protein VKV77_09255 [Methylovirgula sp.]|nr:hypothetical protein [Methylovirgula sp.]